MIRYYIKKRADPFDLPEGGLYKSRPLPNEIVNAIDKLPPLLRESAEENYLGLKVKWRTRLRTIYPPEENVVKVMLDTGEMGIALILCRVDITQYPELKIAKTKQKLWIAGEITNIEFNRIYLSNCIVNID